MTTFINTKKKVKGGNVIFILFLCLYASLLLYTLYNINISEDEAYTLNTTSQNFLTVIRHSYNFEAQPPGYFLLLSFWRKINSSIFFSKLFSVLCIWFAAYFLYKIIRLFHVTKSEIQRWMIVVFLLNPFTVWAALELRLYAFLLLLSVLAVCFFFRYIFEGKKLYLVPLVFICLLGIYTQYFFSFLVVVFAFNVLRLQGWKSFFIFCCYFIPIGILLLPNLFFFSSQINTQQVHNNVNYFTRMLKWIIECPIKMTIHFDNIPNFWLKRLFALIFTLVFLILYPKIYFEKTNDTAIFFKKYNVIIFSVPLLLVFFIIVFGITKVGFAEKYLTILFIFLILLFTIFDFLPKYALRSLFLLLISSFGYELYVQYKHPVNIYDFKTVVKYIERIERRGEPLLIYRPAIALPFKNYYKGDNKIFPIPHPVNFDSSYLINIKDTGTFKNILSDIHTGSGSYLLISDTSTYEGVLNMNRKMIDQYLNIHYKVTIDTFLLGWGKVKSLRIIRFENYSHTF